ncbi:homoserine kinase [compost metagenome]
MNSLDSLMRSISEAYDLHIKHIELIYDAVNKIFRITNDNDSLIFKIFNKRDHSKQRISFERKITSHISSRQPNSINPILAKAQIEKTYLYENQFYYGIPTRECTGNPYLTNAGAQSDDYLFGQALFTLHHIPPPPFRNPKHDTSNVKHLISKLGSPNRSQKTIQLKTIIQTLHNDINLTTLSHTERMKRCICHGDAWPGNALYSSNACTLIDFEHTRISDPAFDVATFIWWLTGSEHTELEKLKSWEQFVNGYGESIKQLINNSTPALIKTNQLRSLIFLHNNIIINEEILEYAQRRTSHLLEKLTPHLKSEQLLEALWKK